MRADTFDTGLSRQATIRSFYGACIFNHIYNRDPIH
jgi:hypothetical protein